MSDNITQVLRKHIDDSGKSLRELEAETGISKSALNLYRNGKSKISAHNLLVLAHYLGFSLAEVKKDGDQIEMEGMK